MKQKSYSILKLTASMVIFGSIGLFVKNIPLQSSMIALFRALTGVVFLVFVMLLKRHPVSTESVKRNALWLCFSGTAIGLNWVLLFESYRYTSVSVSTMCYYMAPILVILFSPFLLRERLTLKKLVCVLTAMAGMVCISGILKSGVQNAEEIKGVLFGVAAAVLYASVILMNKQLKEIDALDKTVLQLAIAALVLIPYNLFTVDFSAVSLTLPSVLLLGVVGIIHTGLAYFLYFDSMEHLNGQSIAICSYIDPVIAVVASVVVLREPFGLLDGIGTALILGSAVVSELPHKRKDSV